MSYSRTEIATLLFESLSGKKKELKKQFTNSSSEIGYFVLDNVLPEKLALKIFDNFPTTDKSIAKKNLKEYKYVAYQMNKYHPILEEVIYAFQDNRIVELIKDICSLENILPDKHLYAGGLSLMSKGNYLNPHLDNSHDKDRENWRVLNLLYYVTPDWKSTDGGNLELWNQGVKNKPITLASTFNRLIVMATHHNSWHSVDSIKANKIRCCVSNYYFSDTPLLSDDQFHVTSFRGRPSQKIRDLYLRFENSLRMSIRKVFKKGLRENPHQYKK